MPHRLRVAKPRNAQQCAGFRQTSCRKTRRVNRRLGGVAQAGQEGIDAFEQRGGVLAQLARGDEVSANPRDWSAAWLAPVTLAETSLAPAAACCTLRAISRVAESCSSMAAAMVVAIPLMSGMVSLMPPLAVAKSTVEVWTAVTGPESCSVA